MTTIASIAMMRAGTPPTLPAIQEYPKELRGQLKGFHVQQLGGTLSLVKEQGSRWVIVFPLS